MFSTSLWARSVRLGLMIRVDGPGELRVSEGHSVWDLRAGNLVRLGNLPTHPLPIWLDGLAQRLATKEHHEKYIQHTMTFAWNELLHHASTMRRGGCLIVLPETGLDAAKVETTFGIHLKYPTNEVGLGKAVAAFVNACQVSAGILDKDQLKEAANQWLRDRYALLSIVESIANLSGVDGCTVLDRDLRLIGFGGKINFSNATEPKNLRDDLTNKFLSKDVMTKTGTRHSSAYRFCQGHDRVSCYVVSQDGHVTAFWSIADTIHRWSPYWPWAKRSDHF